MVIGGVTLRVQAAPEGPGCSKTLASGCKKEALLIALGAFCSPTASAFSSVVAPEAGA